MVKSNYFCGRYNAKDGDFVFTGLGRGLTELVISTLEEEPEGSIRLLAQLSFIAVSKGKRVTLEIPEGRNSIYSTLDNQQKEIYERTLERLQSGELRVSQEAQRYFGAIRC